MKCLHFCKAFWIAYTCIIKLSCFSMSCLVSHRFMSKNLGCIQRKTGYFQTKLGSIWAITGTHYWNSRVLFHYVRFKQAWSQCKNIEIAKYWTVFHDFLFFFKHCFALKPIVNKLIKVPSVSKSQWIMRVSPRGHLNLSIVLSFLFMNKYYTVFLFTRNFPWLFIIQPFSPKALCL